jgi:hypothetical protein
VGFYGYKKGPFDNNGDAKTCGLTAVSGDLRVGGVVRATLKGKAQTIAWSDKEPGKPFEWDLDVVVTAKAGR